MVSNTDNAVENMNITCSIQNPTVSPTTCGVDCPIRASVCVGTTLNCAGTNTNNNACQCDPIASSDGCDNVVRTTKVVTPSLQS